MADVRGVRRGGAPGRRRAARPSTPRWSPQLLVRSRRVDPLAGLTPRETRGARADGRGPVQRRHRRRAGRERGRGREARQLDLHQARPAARPSRTTGACWPCCAGWTAEEERAMTTDTTLQPAADGSTGGRRPEPGPRTAVQVLAVLLSLLLVGWCALTVAEPAGPGSGQRTRTYRRRPDPRRSTPGSSRSRSSARQPRRRVDDPVLPLVARPPHRRQPARRRRAVGSRRPARSRSASAAPARPAGGAGTAYEVRCRHRRRLA